MSFSKRPKNIWKTILSSLNSLAEMWFLRNFKWKNLKTFQDREVSLWASFPFGRANRATRLPSSDTRACTVNDISQMESFARRLLGREVYWPTLDKKSPRIVQIWIMKKNTFWARKRFWFFEKCTPFRANQALVTRSHIEIKLCRWLSQDLANNQ